MLNWSSKFISVRMKLRELWQDRKLMTSLPIFNSYSKDLTCKKQQKKQ